MLLEYSGWSLAFFTIFFAARVPVADEAIQRRLETLSVHTRETGRIRLYAQEEDDTFWEKVATFFFGANAMPGHYNRLSRLLHQAGYRGERAIRIFSGLRIFLCLAFGFGGILMAFLSKASTQDVVMLAVAGAVLGYMLPVSHGLPKSKGSRDGDA